MDLRETMRNFATGVCVATTYSDERGNRRYDALTVNSVVSISVDPPLISVSFRRGSSFLADLLVTKAFALSILDSSGDDIAKSFAKSRDERAATLKALPTVAGTHTGALVIDSVGWLECAVREHLDVGDHTVVIGAVLAGTGDPARRPLIFLRGQFHRPTNACFRQGGLNEVRNMA